MYWLESRPEERGRVALVERDAGGLIHDRVPPNFNIRNRVHEYGGGAYAVHENVLFFSDLKSQQIYRQEPSADPRALTPLPSEDVSVRYADAALTPDGRRMVCVRETHETSGRVTNELALIRTDGSGEPRSLVQGHDFFSSPRIRPDGRQLLWLSWDHPRMPWDGTDLWVADLDDDDRVGKPRHVAGGPEESVFQPEWGPDGEIYFVSDRTDWWNLYVLRDGVVGALAPMEAEFGLPQWVFGLCRYVLMGGGRIVAVYAEKGADHIVVIHVRDRRVEGWPTPYSSISALASDSKDRVALIGASRSTASELVLAEVGSQDHRVLRREIQFDPPSGYLSLPKHIEFPVRDGGRSYAFFYPPSNQDYHTDTSERPPLIVTSHGGPTSSATNSLNLSVQFWTSRGFAVVDVNYRGSTGYGRAYRERLKGQWGVLDATDCVDAALYLADRGEVDRKRMAIRGKSASGFTTLSVLVFHDLFAAGASYYGVADPESLLRDTHKFESRYLDSLIGPYPQARDRYRSRSPLEHAGQLSTPVILFQGLADPVVPPSQAEALIRVLEKKALAFAYITFDDEHHGFRQASSIRRSLEAELYFYSRIFGFEPADRIEPIQIENL